MWLMWDFAGIIWNRPVNENTITYLLIYAFPPLNYALSERKHFIYFMMGVKKKKKKKLWEKKMLVQLVRIICRLKYYQYILSICFNHGIKNVSGLVVNQNDFFLSNYTKKIAEQILCRRCKSAYINWWVETKCSQYRNVQLNFIEWQKPWSGPNIFRSDVWPY